MADVSLITRPEHFHVGEKDWIIVIATLNQVVIIKQILTDN